MTRDEAKKILALYRLGTIPEADPLLAAALELVHNDPELAAWFEQQSAVSEAIRAKLKSIPVPQGLRRQIMVEHHADTRTLPLSSKLLLASALAALVLLTAIVWFKFAPNPRDTFEGYRNLMARIPQRGYSMQMFGTNQAQIREFFGSKGAPVNYVLPPSLDKLPGEGGAVYAWNNHQVSLLCLNGATRLGVKNNLYLFMASRSVLPDAPAPGKNPEFKTVGKLMTMTWTDGDRVYLLAGSGDEATLQKYLE